MGKKRPGLRLWMKILLGVILASGIAYLSFEAVRAIGGANLKKKARQSAPELVQRPDEEMSPEQLPESPEEERWQEGWIRYQGRIYAYNEDIRTFLFMGIDKNSDVEEVEEGTEGGQADALFLAVLNPHRKLIQVIGINRNTMTDIDVYDDQGEYVTTTQAQIAVQHGFGNGLEESCDYQQRAVERLFYQLPIHGYAAVNMSAISTINDAVGGVDVTVQEDLTKVDKTLTEGALVHLTGESAFWYVKYRDAEEFGSADRRLARQKQYLNALIKAAKQAAGEDITVAGRLYQAISAQMVTNISLDEVVYLAPLLVNYRFDADSFYMLEGETVMGERFEEFYADEDALYEMILEIFYEEMKDE